MASVPLLPCLKSGRGGKESSFGCG